MPWRGFVSAETICLEVEEMASGTCARMGLCPPFVEIR
jgi:hypothetical protein